MSGTIDLRSLIARLEQVHSEQGNVPVYLRDADTIGFVSLSTSDFAMESGVLIIGHDDYTRIDFRPLLM